MLNRFFKKGAVNMYKVMIVEDDPKIAEHLQTYIEKYGYQAIMVTSFERIMDDFRENAPDIVLLDINLSSFDGYYWCRQIRQERSEERRVGKECSARRST